MQFMRIGGESAAIIVAIGFVILGLAGLSIAKFFLLGAIVLGCGIALLLHLFRKKPLFPNKFF